MLIRYIGGRSHYAVNMNRDKFYFNKENNKTLEIKDKAVINYIFHLPNHSEFEVVEQEVDVQVEETEEKSSVQNFSPKKPGRPKKG